MNMPPADHYLTHPPKHPGCKACMKCKVQRKHCRDRTKGRQKKIHNELRGETVVEHEIHDAPKVFGDLVTSDSIFAIRRSSTSPARIADTTAPVVCDKATGWVAAYLSTRNSAADILEAVGNSDQK